MRFDANRLANLAGLPTESSESLNEASNRSYHDGVASDTEEDRFGKNQLAEEKHETDKDDADEMKNIDLEEAGLPSDEMEEEVVLEIDEKMLRNEIRRMRAERITGQKLRERKKAGTAKPQKKQRKSSQSIQEAKLRKAIRNEIKGIFEELNSENITSSWIYGDDQPQNSKKGFVNTMFPGVGFR